MIMDIELAASVNWTPPNHAVLTVLHTGGSYWTEPSRMTP
jgi:hypothetical protein